MVTGLGYVLTWIWLFNHPACTSYKEKMGKVINSYIETVLDTKDKESVPALLTRKAPLKYRVIYYLIKFGSNVKTFFFLALYPEPLISSWRFRTRIKPVAAALIYPPVIFPV